MVESSLRIENVNFRESKSWLFKEDVSFEIKRGEITLLFGPSASGKTTLFKILSYLLPPTKGKVLWNGKEIKSIQEANKKRKEVISLIPSQFLFFQNLNVKENLLFSATLSGKKEKEVKKRLEELIETFKFDGDEDIRKISLSFLLKKNIGELSNGQREIVSICRAFLIDAPFILADEMLRSFNEDAEKVVWNTFVNLARKEKKGILLITHKEHLKDYKEVDRIMRIKNRKVITEKGGKNEVS
ncbi:MAG: ATP-binding cassette domain-containing protein [Desulfurobacteriaceae bacterium]